MSKLKYRYLLFEDQSNKGKYFFETVKGFPFKFKDIPFFIYKDYVNGVGYAVACRRSGLRVQKIKGNTVNYTKDLLKEFVKHKGVKSINASERNCIKTVKPKLFKDIKMKIKRMNTPEYALFESRVKGKVIV